MTREGYFCDLTRDQIAEWVSEFNDEAILADGLEGAFMGVCEVSGQPTVAVYDRWKCIEILAEQVDVEEYENPYIDAQENFEFNVAGGWMGENSPRYITLHKLD